MKTTFWVGVLTLSLLVLPERAHAQCCFKCCLPQVNCNAGFKWHFNVCCGSPYAQLGPWYLYYPYEAHFQTPAPVGPFPNWPGAPVAAMSVGPGPALPPVAAPAAQPPVRPLSYVQPVGYVPQQVPSYWYERR
jgi:hypothetical protein